VSSQRRSSARLDGLPVLSGLRYLGVRQVAEFSNGSGHLAAVKFGSEGGTECQTAEGAAIRNLAARTRPSFARSFRLPENGGRRECRVFGTPAASRTKQKVRECVTTGTPKQSGIPCAMVLRFIRDLPGVPGLIASIAQRIDSAKLDSSVGESGPHDFAVRLVHRSSCDPKASIASRTQRP
jgi:hypothetical protein